MLLYTSLRSYAKARAFAVPNGKYWSQSASLWFVAASYRTKVLKAAFSGWPRASPGAASSSSLLRSYAETTPFEL